MARTLTGGCRVWSLKEGRPRTAGGVRVWNRAGRRSGAKAISLRVIEFAAGASPGFRNSDADEVLYVLDGRATVNLDGRPHRVGPDTGLYVRPGAVLTVDNPGPGPLTCVSSRCPDPGDALRPVPRRTIAAVGTGRESPSPVVRLADRPSETTGDRSYRVLVDRSVGCEAVTQFVGTIPPGRAPDHFHHYEEVLCILEGKGRIWAGRSHAPIGPGSCVFLPRGQVHCVENAGDGPLRLLGVFYPAGSPAARVRAYRTTSSTRNARPRK
jgi:mannose-6-phosphate isomerase-like protein (cupin superfamily)